MNDGASPLRLRLKALQDDACGGGGVIAASNFRQDGFRAQFLHDLLRQVKAGQNLDFGVDDALASHIGSSDRSAQSKLEGPTCSGAE